MKTKGLIFIFFIVIAIIAFVYTIINRAVKKGGILGFLKSKEITFQELLVAHESGHNIAINTGDKKFYLIKYASKKKEYQHREFGFDQFDRADFYLDGIRVYSLSKTSSNLDIIHFTKNELNRNVVSIRLYVTGVELPYILTLDQFAEGSGASISDGNLENNVKQWQYGLLQLAGVINNV